MLRQPLLNSIAGLILIGVGCTGLYLHFQSEKPPVATLQVLTEENEKRCTVKPQLHGGLPLLECTASHTLRPTFVISLNITPTKTHTGDVAVLTATTKLGKDSSYQLFGSLNSVGVQLEPKGSMPFTWTSDKDPELYTASWTIKAKDASRYPIVFTPLLKRLLQPAAVRKIPLKTSTSETTTPVDDLDPPRTIVEGGNVVILDVSSKWSDYFSKGWSPFVTFMGSLMTLPGIISFFQNRRKNKHLLYPEPTEPMPF